MASNPDPAWRTSTVAIRPWAATLSQHGLPKVVAVTRIGSAAAEVARTTGGRPRARGEQGQARTLLQEAEVAGEDGEFDWCLRVRPREERVRVPDTEKAIGVWCASRQHRGCEELAPVRLEYGHRDQQDAQGAVRARLFHRSLHQDGRGVEEQHLAMSHAADQAHAPCPIRDAKRIDGLRAGLVEPAPEARGPGVRLGCESVHGDAAPARIDGGAVHTSVNLAVACQ
jgi:hypothetical protein